MIKEILSLLFTMSIRGSFVILLVLILRLCFQRAPKIFSYILWLAVLLRLLCPIAAESNLSALGLGQKALSYLEQGGHLSRELFGRQDTEAVKATGQDYPAEVVFLTPQTPSDTPFGADIAEETTQPETPDSGSISQTHLITPWADRILFGVWLTGMVLILCYTLFCSLRLSLFLRSAVRQNDRIYVQKGISTPFVRGLVLPKIYLPEGLGESEQKYVLLHEKIHIRRGDILFRHLAFLALLLHWFNPLVWAAFFLSERDMEMSCDEAVLKRLGNSIKKEYSGSLLRISQDAGGLLGFPLAFGEKSTKKRIQNILSYHKAKKAFVCVCVCELVLVFVMLATNPKAATAETDAGGTIAEDSNHGKPDGTDTQSGYDSLEKINGQIYAISDEQKVAVNGTETAQDNLAGSASANTEDIDRNPFEALIYVKSISKSARVIDRYQGIVGADGITEIEEDAFRGGEPAFAENCSYYVNYSWTNLNIEEVDFDTFAEFFADVSDDLVQTCRIKVQDGLISSITLLSDRYPSGLSYSEYKSDFYSQYDQLTELYGNDMLKKYYHLTDSLEADISDAPGMETIEIYTGDVGDGESGLVLFKDSDGKLLYNEWAHAARVGWNNVYYGKIDGGGDGFIMTLHLENRDTEGLYDYQVYRLTPDGGIAQMEGASFEWGGPGQEYNADNLAYWCHMLGHRLADSVLLLSTQEGELRTGQMSDKDRYCYRTLVPESFPDPYEGLDIR